MLILVLYMDHGDTVEYNFFPEGKEAYGTISINKSTGDIDVIKRADGDERERYLAHAIWRVMKYQKIGEYPQEATVAWY